MPEDPASSMRLIAWNADNTRPDELLFGAFIKDLRAGIVTFEVQADPPPIGDRKMRWPGHAPYEGSFYDLFPSWNEYWSRRQPNDQPVAPPAPLDKFIESMRRGHRLPKPRVRT